MPLVQLQVLQLSSNKLIELPAQLGTCSQLEDLDVSDNYLQVRRGLTCKRNSISRVFDWFSYMKCIPSCCQCCWIEKCDQSTRRSAGQPGDAGLLLPVKHLCLVHCSAVMLLWLGKHCACSVHADAALQVVATYLIHGQC